MRKLHIILLILTLDSCAPTITNRQSAEEQYRTEQNITAKAASDHIYSDFPAFYSVGQERFVATIDSLEQLFNENLTKYSRKLPEEMVQKEQAEIEYFFDRLLLEYPEHHYAYTGEYQDLSQESEAGLTPHQSDFNHTALLSNSDFLAYIRSFLAKEARRELLDPKYDTLDNQTLRATWKLIDIWFSKQQVNDYWKQEYLFQHIDNFGIKNIDPIYHDFLQSCQDQAYREKIIKIYEEHRISREAHQIEIYKKVDSYALEMHLFLPDSKQYEGPLPTIVYFHGGSWSEGKPDWFFGEAARHAERGWVAAAVEYRIKARHGTLPFAAVKDARSAIRWLRTKADLYHIDPEKIVATGNSAGGHLVLATALADEWNEPTDELEVSPAPNALMVTSGVYDLIVENASWIKRGIGSIEPVLEISPNHLMKAGLPPTLMIHGTADMNCPYTTARHFAEEMRALGNEIEFHSIPDAGHFIWFGEHGAEVGQIKAEFMESLNFE
jgi:acetyl esterase/lipase